MRKNLHHAIPGLRGVADRALDRKLLVKDLIDRKPHFATANSHLRVFSQGPERFDTATHGVRMTSAFKGNVEAPSVRVLLDGITYASWSPRPRPRCDVRFQDAGRLRQHRQQWY